LVRRSGGIFEVTYRGELVYSKKALKRFPDPGEVEDLIAARSKR
jgi:selenoprotein W-related protein